MALSFHAYVQVKHKSSTGISEEDEWCWEQSSIDVDVGIEDVKGIVFVQKGYWITIVSTHDVDAYIDQPDASSVNLQIKVSERELSGIESYVITIEFYASLT